jgi:hypothetical protein
MGHIPRYLAPCSNPNHPLDWVQAMSTIASLTAERDAALARIEELEHALESHENGLANAH